MMSLKQRNQSPGFVANLVRALGITAAAAVLTVVAWSLHLEYRSEVERAESRLRNYSLLVGEHTERAISEADQMLMRGTAAILSASALGTPANTADLHQRFRAIVADLPHAPAMNLIGPDGRSIVHSERHPPPDVDLSDREHFIAHRDKLVTGLYLARPVQSRVRTEVLIPISRSVSTPDGQWLGVIGAGIDARYFDRVYDKLDLGTSERIRLLRTDGLQVAARPPTTQPPGAVFDGFAALTIGAAPGSTITRHQVLPGDVTTSVVVVHALANQPLLIVHSIAEQEVLRDWRARANVAVFTALAVALLLAGAAIALARRLKLDAEQQAALQDAEARWRFAMDGAGHGVWDWDIVQDRVVRSVSTLKLTGLAADVAANIGPLLPSIHPDDRDRARAFLSDCAAGARESFSTEVRIGSDTTAHWILLRGNVLHRDHTGKPERIIGTVTDIDALKRSQADVVDQQQRLDGILQSAMDAIITIDDAQRIVLYNQAAERTFGTPAAEAIGADLERFLPQRFRDGHRALVRRFGATGVSTRHMSTGSTLYGLRANGEEFPIDASISQITIGDHKFFTVILRDITERVRTDAELHNSQVELRELAARLDAVREEEQHNLARELHDEMGAILTALHMDIASLEADSRLPAALRARIQDVHALVAEATRVTRTIIEGLRPPILDLGLVPALDWQTRDFVRRTGIACVFTTSDEDIEVAPEVAITIFRLVQEALTNIIKHAAAANVEVRLQRESDRLTIEIDDDGRGISATDHTKKGHFGLIGMRERMRRVGGHIKIAARSGGGTTVVITLPLSVRAEVSRSHFTTSLRP
jgi:PAS domain S-box-containing protein